MEIIERLDAIREDAARHTLLNQLIEMRYFSLPSIYDEEDDSDYELPSYYQNSTALESTRSERYNLRSNSTANTPFLCLDESIISGDHHEDEPQSSEFDSSELFDDDDSSRDSCHSSQ
jgi:hypothetical protein